MTRPVPVRNGPTACCVRRIGGQVQAAVGTQAVTKAVFLPPVLSWFAMPRSGTDSCTVQATPARSHGLAVFCARIRGCSGGD
jgi:hypothetical protein